MIVDAHVHVARLAGLKLPRETWLGPAADAASVTGVYRPDGTADPAALDELFGGQGVDRVLMFCEYSPRVTGIQAIEDRRGDDDDQSFAEAEVKEGAEHRGMPNVEHRMPKECSVSPVWCSSVTARRAIG